MLEDKRKPEIRFSEFTEDWNQNKLSEYLMTSSEKNADNYYGADDVLSVSGEEGIVNQIEFKGRSYAGSSTTGYGVVKFGDVVYTKSPLKSNPYGIIKTNKGTSGIVSALYAIYHPTESTFSNFVQDYFNQDSRVNKYLRPLINKGAKNTIGVSNEMALTGTVIFPNIKEQIAISDFLSSLNHLITANQQKYNQLVNIKSTLLKKMFPRDDAKSPEIRIVGCTNDWEQYKFGEIVEKYEDPVPTPHEGYERLGILSHAKGTFHSYVKRGQELETAQMHRVAAGNFIVNITFGWEHAVAITTEDDAGKLVSHRFPQFKFHDGFVPEFFKYVILDENFRHHLWLSSPGGAGRNRVLNIPEMLEYKMMVPSKEEQEKIVEILGGCDYLISLQQQKIDQLKNVKQSFLDKMFVS